MVGVRRALVDCAAAGMDVVLDHEAMDAGAGSAKARAQEMEKAVKPHGRVFLMCLDQCAEKPGIVPVALAGFPVLVCVVGTPGNMKGTA